MGKHEYEKREFPLRNRARSFNVTRQSSRSAENLSSFFFPLELPREPRNIFSPFNRKFVKSSNNLYRYRCGRLLRARVKRTARQCIIVKRRLNIFSNKPEIVHVRFGHSHREYPKRLCRKNTAKRPVRQPLGKFLPDHFPCIVLVTGPIKNVSAIRIQHDQSRLGSVFLDHVVYRTAQANRCKMADLLKSSNVHNIFTQLGTFVGDEYVPSDDCYRE